MKQSNVVKYFALVCALSMPLAAFAASPGGAGTGGAAGTGAAGTGGASTGAPGAGTAGTGGTGGGPATGTATGNSTNPSRRAPAAYAARQAHRHQVGSGAWMNRASMKGPLVGGPCSL